MKEKRIIGTIGNNDGYITCSMYVAQKRYADSLIVPYTTFEEAAQHLKREIIDSILVPAAYPNLRDFIMDSELLANSVFLERTPPLVCVCKDKETKLETITHVFLHPATRKLVSELGIDNEKVSLTYVNSNIDACLRLLNNPSNSCLSITNLKCAEYYKLWVIKELRSDVMMPWVSFIKMPSGEVTLKEND